MVQTRSLVSDCVSARGGADPRVIPDEPERRTRVFGYIERHSEGASTETRRIREQRNVQHSLFRSFRRSARSLYFGRVLSWKVTSSFISLPSRTMTAVVVSPGLDELRTYIKSSMLAISWVPSFTRRSPRCMPALSAPPPGRTP